MYVVDGQGRKKRHVVGLAPVSGMCNSLNSCTISEGTSFQVKNREQFILFIVLKQFHAYYFSLPFCLLYYRA